jgi:hypothetical protein
MKSLFKVYILLLFICRILSAQSSANSIHGIITDGVSGEVLIGTSVMIYRSGELKQENLVTGALTNRYGYYLIENIEPGSYSLVVKNIGYKTQSTEMKISGNNNSIKKNLQLTSEDIKLKEMVIQDKAEKESSVNSINIPLQVIKTLPSFTGELEIFKDLQMLPGIATVSEMSSGLYIRGGSPDQNITLVDGMMLYNPSHLGNFSSTFNSNSTQDIKLIKGAYPAEYGGRLSSVLDIKLKAGTKEKDRGSLNLGTISSSLNLEGPLSSNATYNISGRWMYYDLLEKNLIKSNNIPFYNYYDINGKFTFTLKEESVFSISAFVSKDDFYDDRTTSDVNYDDKWKNLALNLNWLQITGGSVFTNTSVNIIQYETSSLFTNNVLDKRFTDYYSDSKITDVTIKRIIDYQRPSYTLKAGFEAASHMFSLIATNFYSYDFETNTDIKKTLNDFDASAFVQNDFKITPFMFSNLGMRFFYFFNGHYFDAEPRASVSYNITDDFSVKTALGITHQYIHLIMRDDLTIPTDFWYPSSANIKPSKSEQLVTSFDYYFLNKTYNFTFDVYYRKMDNLLEFKNNAQFNISEPIESIVTSGEGEAYGMEFFLQKRDGPLFGWIGYTLSWTKLKFAELNNGNIFSPRYDIRNDLSFVLGYDFSDNFHSGLSWIYASGQAVNEPTGQYLFNDSNNPNNSQLFITYGDKNSFRLPSYHKLDLNCSYKLLVTNPSVEFHFNIYNLYNRANVFAQYITQVASPSGTVNSIKIKNLTLFPIIPTLGVSLIF